MNPIQLPDNLGSFFTFIGSNAAIGFAISWVMFNWAWFQKRASGEKVTLLVIIASGMGVLSHLLVKYVPAGVVVDAQPYYQAIFSAMVVLGGSKAWHDLVNTKGETPADSIGINADAQKSATATSAGTFTVTSGTPPAIATPADAIPG